MEINNKVDSKLSDKLDSITDQIFIKMNKFSADFSE